MKLRDLLTAFAVLALGLAPTLSAVAEPTPSPAPVATALGDEGQLYQMVPGTLGALFPEGGALPDDTPALALDSVAPDGTVERSLVPGSEGPEVEGSPSVVFEETSSRLYAVWESKKTPTISRLLLASFGAEGWSEPIEISGDVSPLKDEPSVLITRDRFSLPDVTSERSTRSRTTIHVVWREEGTEGSALFYTPVVLEAGRYLGWNPVVPLAELEPEAAESEPEAGALELLRTPTLIAGQDVQSVIIGYLSPASGRLLSVEARLLPGEVGVLADHIRAVIIEIGARDRGTIRQAAERSRDHVLDVGHRLNGGILEHFADRVHSAVLGLSETDPEEPIGALADDIRAVIVEIGARLFGGPGTRARTSTLMEVGGTPTEDSAGPSTPSVAHLVDLRVVSSRPAPPLDDVPAKMFLSEDGERVLVGWLHEGKVYYTESSEEPGPEGESWTAVRHMTLTERLGIPEAAAILEARVRRQR